MYVDLACAMTTAPGLRDANCQRGGPKESLRRIEGYERLTELGSPRAKVET